MWSKIVGFFLYIILIFALLSEEEVGSAEEQPTRNSSMHILKMGGIHLPPLFIFGHAYV